MKKDSDAIVLTDGHRPSATCWNIAIQRDVVRGQWHPTYQATVHWEEFFLVARFGGVNYIHFYRFRDDYDLAQRVLARIQAKPDFTPVGNKYWQRVADMTPVEPRKRKVVIGQ